MADKAELEVTIGADGTVKITTRGLRGEACIEETKALEKALGKVLRRQKTGEYYERSASTKTGVRSK